MTTVFVISFLIVYIIFAIAFYNMLIGPALESLPDGSVYPADVYDEFEENNISIKCLLTILWPSTVFFILGWRIGMTIYETKLIRDEDDRIAAWFV